MRYYAEYESELATVGLPNHGHVKLHSTSDSEARKEAFSILHLLRCVHKSVTLLFLYKEDGGKYFNVV